jgi:hypothetical protein
MWLNYDEQYAVSEDGDVMNRKTGCILKQPLNLDGYRFVYEELVVDDAIDYVDVYLYGVKQPKDRFQVTFDSNSITITFTESITRVPADVVRTDFEIKGKIVEIG